MATSMAWRNLLLLLLSVAVTRGQVCDSVLCKKLASRMLVQMGHEAVPCDNFYRYACGGLFNDPFIKQFDRERDVLERLHDVIKKTDYSSLPAFQQFKDYYRSCRNMKSQVKYAEEWVNEVMEALKDTAMFNPPKKNVNFTQLFLTTLKYDSPVAFDITLDLDEKNSSKLIFKINVPMQKSPFITEDVWVRLCQENANISGNSKINLNDIYDTATECKKDKISVTVNKFDSILKTLNKYLSLHFTGQDIAGINFELETLQKFNLATMPKMADLKESLSSKKYILMTVGDLQEKFKEVDWRILLRNLVKREVSEDTPVHMYSLSYMKELFNRLRPKTSRKLLNRYNGYLASFVYKLYYELILYRHNNKDYCMHIASSMMEDVAIKAYISTFSTGELDSITNGAQHIFLQLKNTFNQLLEDAEWLDATTKSHLKHKLYNVHLDFLPSKDMEYKLDEYIMVPTEYFSNTMKLYQRHRSRMYSNYGKNPQDPDTIWSLFLSPMSTSSSSIHGLNLIAMPIPLLANPLFSQNYPNFTVMPRLGFELAHQLAHHFDSEGLMYVNGTRMKNTLLEGSQSKYYKGMETCFNQPYSYRKTGLAPDGKHVDYQPDSKLSKNERLADDVAVMLVETFLRNNSFLLEPSLPFLNMSNSQIFYILLAQNFCSKQILFSSALSLFEDEKLPPFLRVNHIATNSEGFVDVFKCPGSARLRPALRCEVFPKLTDITPSVFSADDYSYDIHD